MSAFIGEQKQILAQKKVQILHAQTGSVTLEQLNN